MKKFIIVLAIAVFAIYSCSTDNDLEINQANVTLNFTHNWKDSITVTNADFNDFKFTNENGEMLSIVKLRYLVSDVTLINQNGDTIITNDYNLVDVTNDENLSFSLSETIPAGTYKSVKFTFGFDEEDNIDGAYNDLNTKNFNVPAMLGGGYHFMQFDGKFIDNSGSEANFNYHTIEAVEDNSDPNNIITQDTSFEVNLGTISFGGDTTIEIDVDLAEWFKSPNTWNLNELNTVLMPNFDAQIMMSENGKTVFSLAD